MKKRCVILVFTSLTLISVAQSNLKDTVYYQAIDDSTFLAMRKEMSGELVVVSIFEKSKKDTTLLLSSRAFEENVIKTYNRLDNIRSSFHNFYKNGNLKYYDETIKGTIKDGPFYKFHENGFVEQSGRYSNNLEIGEWRYFDSLGRISKVENYIVVYDEKDPFNDDKEYVARFGLVHKSLKHGVFEYYKEGVLDYKKYYLNDIEVTEVVYNKYVTNNSKTVKKAKRKRLRVKIIFERS
jgi:hypothetical protein